MDGKRFDDWNIDWTAVASRRTVVRVLAGGTLSSVVDLLAVRQAEAAPVRSVRVAVSVVAPAGAERVARRDEAPVAPATTPANSRVASAAMGIPPVAAT
jgi:hypothetical protein